jgi:hypothetical protein
MSRAAGGAWTRREEMKLVTIGEKEAARRHAREQALLSPRGAGEVRQGERMSLSTRDG